MGDDPATLRGADAGAPGGRTGGVERAERAKHHGGRHVGGRLTGPGGQQFAEPALGGRRGADDDAILVEHDDPRVLAVRVRRWCLEQSPAQRRAGKRRRGTQERRNAR